MDVGKTITSAVAVTQAVGGNNNLQIDFIIKAAINSLVWMLNKWEVMSRLQLLKHILTLLPVIINNINYRDISLAPTSPR